jgi:hypothetical protein
MLNTIGVNDYYIDAKVPNTYEIAQRTKFHFQNFKKKYSRKTAGKRFELMLKIPSSPLSELCVGLNFVCNCLDFHLLE